MQQVYDQRRMFRVCHGLTVGKKDETPARLSKLHELIDRKTGIIPVVNKVHVGAEVSDRSGQLVTNLSPHLVVGTVSTDNERVVTVGQLLHGPICSPKVFASMFPPHTTMPT